MSGLYEAALPYFARHETFHPRYGWFGKGVTAANRNPAVFSSDEATVDLGVGKNMVLAIRFWCRAAKLFVDVPKPETSRTSHATVTERGRVLFDRERGLDPYLELPGSLWLLHWWMLSPRCLLPAWWIAFNQFTALEFSDDELISSICGIVEEVENWSNPARSSIVKDVDCLIRMYSSRRAAPSGLEDSLDCPFRDLGLMAPVWNENRKFRFLLGPKATLPPAVLAYACIEFIGRHQDGARTATIGRLTSAPGSPGRAFKLTEDALTTSLAQYEATATGIQLVSSAGATQVALRGGPDELALAALTSYYGEFRTQVVHPLPTDVRPAHSDGSHLSDRDGANGLVGVYS